MKAINKLFDIPGFFTAFRFEWSNSFVFNGESHNFWEAVFVESGEVEVTEDENVYTLSEGNVIFHAPMEFHRIKSSGGSAPTGFICSFQASGELPSAIKEGVFGMDALQRNLYEEFSKSLCDFVNNGGSALLGTKSAALLKAFIIKMAERPAKTKSSASHSALEYKRIASFMQKNVCESLTLDDIACRTNVSVSYIKALFNTYAGISPKSYFNQLRIQKAAELLSGGYSVTEVASAMNFTCPNYFSVFFKRHTGAPPSRYF